MAVPSERRVRQERLAWLDPAGPPVLPGRPVPMGSREQQDRPEQSVPLELLAQRASREPRD